jgi:hypothetical protein
MRPCDAKLQKDTGSYSDLQNFHNKKYLRNLCSHLPKVGSVGRKRSILYKKMCGKVLRQRQLWENVTCLFMDALRLGSSMHYPVPCCLALAFTIFRFFLVKAHSRVSR